MRMITLVMALAIGCGGGQKTAASGGGDGSGTDGSGTATATTAPRMDLHCTPQADFDELLCGAQAEGCHYGPPLICRGIEVDDETKEREREAYEAGTGPCVCICPEDQRQCSMVP